MLTESATAGWGEELWRVSLSRAGLLIMIMVLAWPHSFNPEIIWCQVVIWKLWPSQEWGVLHQVGNIFHLLGVLVQQEFRDTVMYIPWGGTKTLPPKLYNCFLTSPLLFLHPLPFLTSSCLNLLFGTQRSGNRKAFVLRSPTGSYLVSIFLILKNSEIILFATLWMNLGSILLSEICQTKTNTEQSPLYVEYE